MEPPLAGRVFDTLRAMRYLLLALALTGCVKKSTYKKSLAENARLQAEMADHQKKSAATEKSLADKIKDLQGQLGQLDEATKAEIGKVTKEKAATEAELAELRRQKEAAEKRIAAYKALQDKFRALVDTGKLQVVFRNGQMTLKLPSGIDLVLRAQRLELGVDLLVCRGDLGEPRGRPRRLGAVPQA